MKKLSLPEAVQAHTAVDWQSLGLTHFAPALEIVIDWIRVSCQVSAGHSKPQYNLWGESVNRGSGVGWRCPWKTSLGGKWSVGSWKQKPYNCVFIQPVPGRQEALTGQCKHPDCLLAWWGAEASWGTSN